MKKIIFAIGLIFSLTAFSQVNKLEFTRDGDVAGQDVVDNIPDIAQLYTDLGANADDFIDTLNTYIDVAAGTRAIVTTINLWYDNAFYDVLEANYTGHAYSIIKMVQLLGSNDESAQSLLVCKLQTEKMLSNLTYDVATWKSQGDTVTAYDVIRKQHYEGQIITYDVDNYVIIKRLGAGIRPYPYHYCDYFSIKLSE